MEGGQVLAENQSGAVVAEEAWARVRMDGRPIEVGARACESRIRLIGMAGMRRLEMHAGLCRQAG